MNNEFYLRSRHGDCGSNVMFHNQGGCGYGTDLDNLHVFSAEEAQKHLNHDITSLPLLKSEVDKLAIRAVDMQCLDSKKDVIDTSLIGPATYVLQLVGLWNGNDICFRVGESKTYNYDEAEKYSFIDAFNLHREKSGFIIWGTDYLDTIARRTFQSHNIDTRKMITGAGIKYKKPRKPRLTSGKTRGNCPECGKITWDYNPYENAYCEDHLHDHQINSTFSDSSGCF